MSKKRQSEGCDLNMTPMIDVVFQLIIFFIVTINIAEQKDETIRLELGPNGQDVESDASSNLSAMIVDVAKNGRVSMGNVTLTAQKLRDVLHARFRRQGNSFQVWVRGDARASHKQIRQVMDLCTAEGIGRVTFIAVKDARTPEQKEFLAKRARQRR